MKIHSLVVLKMRIFLLFSLLSLVTKSQAPQGFNYQAIARNLSGSPIINQLIGLQISLRQTSPTGTIVYSETHTTTSSNIGLVNLIVGNGIPSSGVFSSIDWGSGPYFIEVSIDITGGSSFVLMGTQQLMSVPYALFAESTNSGVSATSWNITGNAGNLDGVNFIGNTDNTPLNFRVNNQIAGRIDPINQNTFLGYNAGIVFGSAYQNVAIGSNALNSISTGYANVAVGVNSLNSNTTGDQNTAMGLDVLQNNINGRHNDAIGYRALFANINGGYNSAHGGYSLFSNVSGIGNTAIGYNSLQENITGNSNTALGYFAFSTGQTFSNSTAIGYNTAITANSQVRIGDVSIASIGGFVNWTNISDGRFKINIQESVPGLEFIKKLRPVTYQLDMDKVASYMNIPDSLRLKNFEAAKQEMIQTGFIAQEVEKVAAELGFSFSGVDKPKNSTDYYGLRYAEFVVPIVKAMQEQQAQIEELKKQLEEQNKKIQQLEKK